MNLGERVKQIIPLDLLVPAVGQGAVAIEIREDEPDVRGLVARLNHEATRTCVAAERAFLRRLEGGCQVPIGGYATLTGNRLRLEGVVGNTDGTVVYRDQIEDDSSKAEEIGIRLAEILIGMGADRLLDETRAQTTDSLGAAP